MRRTPILTALAVMACHTAARADLQEFEYSGTVSVFCDDGGDWGEHLFGETEEGDGFELTYRFDDDSSPDAEALSTLSDEGPIPPPTTAFFSGIMQNVSVTIGSAVFNFDDFFGGGNQIAVTDSYQGFGADEYVITLGGTGQGVLGAQLVLSDSTGLAFESNDLPSSLSLSSFDSISLIFFPTETFNPEGSFATMGDISLTVSTVPAPGAALLGLIGLAGVGWTRRLD